MPFDRFFIGPVNSGLQTNLKPFMIPDDAFERLQNAYVFRGRVRKRFGSNLMRGTVAPTAGREQLQSRLRINIGNTPGPLNIPPNTAGALQIGQMFSVGSDIFTIWQLGAGVTTLSTNPAITCTIDSVAVPNTVTFVGAPPATAVYWYPARSVMGLMNYEVQNINDEPIFAFDTRFSYQFTATGWEILGPVPPAAGSGLWNGGNSNFFWGTNWRGTNSQDRLLFVTNYFDTGALATSDPIKYWNGATWTNFTPGFTSTIAANVIVTARIIVVFKDRLVLLNTVENQGGANIVYPNRCRFSQNGDPIAVNAFYDDIRGRGGFIDAPTKEAIITAQFLKDRLIVYFETSTWELIYTGNEILPFRWQQINTELGAESTFSQVPFDKVVVGVGNVGIHACNGINVERIDEKIPDEVFEVHNENNGIERVYGIRDYYAEMVYWTFPSQDRDANFPFPNRILVYNYATGSWALNDDSFTAFGYYQNNASSTWASTTSTWSATTSTWGSAPLQALFRNVIAGNQEGFIVILQRDVPENAESLQITNITTVAGNTRLNVINHNLSVGDYIMIQNAVWDDASNSLNDQIFQVTFVVDSNNIEIGPFPFTGNYIGGGTIRRVSQIDILTKQYNFYQQKGKNIFIEKVDFLVDRTDNGQVLIDYYSSSSDQSMVQGGTATGALLGNNVLETTAYALVPLESFQDVLWHPAYLQSDGEFIQLQITLNDTQMRTPAIVHSDFQLNGMVFYSMSISRLQ